jgi:broad specificity phosphatase PhoE
VLLQHGETAWSAAGRHTGRTDVPLTARGERVASAAGEPLREFDLVLALTSPLQRARRTASLARLDAGSGRPAVRPGQPAIDRWNFGPLVPP